MALSATIYNFTVELADADRNLYQTLEIKAALHPSETEEYLLTRVLAWCLEFREGISFAKGGISDRDEPTLFARDLTGALTLWVEIGIPAADRLHLAAKSSADTVAVYCHKDPRQLEKLRDAGIHKAAGIDVVVLDPEFISALKQHLQRRMNFVLTVSEKHLYCSVQESSFDCPLNSFSLIKDS